MKNNFLKTVISGFVVFSLVLSVCGCSDFESQTTDNGKNETGSNSAGASADSTDELLKGNYYAEIVVEKYGTIKLTLDADTAPITVTNFKKLADKGFYNGLTFHRIIKGFMIQGGCPLGNGLGGSEENIKGEFLLNGVENNISHKRGVISMARSADYDSASSQFFIVQKDSKHLDFQYAAFGTVTEGMDIVDNICDDAVPVDDNGTIPKENQPVITSVTVKKQ